MKATILTIQFILVTTLVFSQKVNESIIKKDLNNDGVKETIETTSIYNSLDSYVSCTIYNHKTKKKYSLKYYWTDGNLRVTVRYKEDLIKPENKIFLNELRKRTFGFKFKTKPEATLEWIINGIYSTKYLVNNDFFKSTCNPKNNWKYGKIEMPSSYYVDIKGDTLKKLYDSFEDYYDTSKTVFYKNEVASLIYLGGFHYSKNEDSLKLIDSSIR